MKDIDIQIIKDNALTQHEIEYYIERMGIRVEHNGMNEADAIKLTLEEIKCTRDC